MIFNTGQSRDLWWLLLPVVVGLGIVGAIIWANWDADGRCAFAQGFHLFWGRTYVCQP